MCEKSIFHISSEGKSFKGIQDTYFLNVKSLNVRAGISESQGVKVFALVIVFLMTFPR